MACAVEGGFFIGGRFGGARGFPELIDVVFGDQIGAGEHAGAFRNRTTHQIVEQANGGVVTLSKRVLADGAIDDTLLHIFHGLIDEVEGDHFHHAGLASIFNSFGSAEGAASGDIDAAQVGVGGHEVIGLGEGGVGFVLVFDRANDLDAGEVFLQRVFKALAAQFVRFDREETGDDGDFAFAFQGFAHGFAGGFALFVQVSADEEHTAVFGGGFRVEGCHGDAGFDSLIHEGGHASIAGDGCNGVIFLRDCGFDGLTEDFGGVLVTRHNPFHGYIVGGQFFGGLQCAFFDRDPERVVLETQHRDLHRFVRFLVHRFYRGFVSRLACAVEGGEGRFFGFGRSGRRLSSRLGGFGSRGCRGGLAGAEHHAQNHNHSQENKHAVFLHRLSSLISDLTDWFGSMELSIEWNSGLGNSAA